MALLAHLNIFYMFFYFLFLKSFLCFLICHHQELGVVLFWFVTLLYISFWVGEVVPFTRLNLSLHFQATVLVP